MVLRIGAVGFEIVIYPFEFKVNTNLGNRI
jgi:hypothetical protein